MASRTQLLHLVKQAREKALSTVDADTDHADHLLGDCSRNAVTLLRYFDANLSDATPELRAGGVDYTGEPTPETMAQAKRDGTTHYWVEVGLDETRYICDLCSESDNAPGELIVRQTRPDDYHAVGETYTVADLDTGACPHDELLLHNALRATRDSELDAHGATEAEAYVLEGHCHDLGEELLRRLAPAWLEQDPLTEQGRVDCYAVVGGLDSSTDTFDTSKPLSRFDVEPRDHVWVEAVKVTEDGEQRYICDAYARTVWREGQPRVMTTLPDEYVRTIDGRVPVEEFDSEYGWVRYRT